MLIDVPCKSKLIEKIDTFQNNYAGMDFPLTSDIISGFLI